MSKFTGYKHIDSCCCVYGGGTPIDEVQAQRDLKKSSFSFGSISIGCPSKFLGALAQESVSRSRDLGAEINATPEMLAVGYEIMNLANEADSTLYRLIQGRASRWGATGAGKAEQDLFNYYNGAYKSVTAKVKTLIQKFDKLSQGVVSKRRKAIDDYNAAQAAGKNERERLEKIALDKLASDIAAKQTLGKPTPKRRVVTKPLSKPIGRR